MTALRRRSFLLGSIAAALATAAPPAPAVPAAPVAPAMVPGTAMATTVREYGFSTNGGEWWSCGFSSREEAKLAALDELGPGDGAKVGLVIFRSLYHPDYAEAVAEQFLNGGCKEMGQTLIDALTGCNEENDFEGDFISTADFVGPAELDQPARLAVAASMLRLGVATLAELVMLQGFSDIEELDDALVEGLAKDATLSAELEALMRGWCERHELDKQLRTLDSYEEEEVMRPAPAPSPLPA